MNDIKSRILSDIDELEKKGSKELLKISNKYYKELPESDNEFIELCDSFVKSNNWNLFNTVTLWLKKRKSAIDIRYIEIFDEWINLYIKDWGMCDQLCYRLINPLVEKYDQMYDRLLLWSDSTNKNVRRVSLVSFIRSSQKLIVYYDFERVIKIVDKLKKDDDIHVQKAVGWVLKCCYTNYQTELVSYLKENISSLSRLVFRYSLENMPKDIKAELMKL